MARYGAAALLPDCAPLAGPLGAAAGRPVAGPQVPPTLVRCPATRQAGAPRPPATMRLRADQRVKDVQPQAPRRGVGGITRAPPCSRRLRSRTMAVEAAAQGSSEPVGRPCPSILHDAGGAEGEARGPVTHCLDAIATSDSDGGGRGRSSCRQGGGEGCRGVRVRRGNASGGLTSFSDPDWTAVLNWYLAFGTDVGRWTHMKQR